MKWLRNIKKKVMLGKRLSRGLRVRRVGLKLKALTGGVLQSAFNNFAKFTEKHLS